MGYHGVFPNLLENLEGDSYTTLGRASVTGLFNSPWVVVYVSVTVSVPHFSLGLPVLGIVQCL